MKFWALADTHLAGAVEKPMDVFGEHWRDHDQRIAANWRERVADEDWVLLPGDISWALRLEDALVDLRFLDALPGRKVLIKGNHDYWWTSRGKVNKVLPPSLHLLQNDHLELAPGIGVAGTRGWNPPGMQGATEKDEKIYRREVHRLGLSLDAAAGHYETLIVMLHYPPIYVGWGETDFVPLLERAGATVCLYGHLHGPNQRVGFQGERGGVRYRLVAADAIDFTPVPLDLSPGNSVAP